MSLADTRNTWKVTLYVVASVWLFEKCTTKYVYINSHQSEFSLKNCFVIVIVILLVVIIIIIII